jgi:putative glutamine amidotransferase
MSKIDEINFQAPIIGITGMRWPDEKKEDMHQMDKTQVHYIEAIQKSKGIPIVLPVLEEFNTETIKRQVSLVDAILIQGGIDVTPSFYGEEALPELDITCIKTDKFLLEVIKYAKERKIPILGICKGMQLINVSYGGTLYQDIKYAGLDSKSHRQSEESITKPFHSINIEKNSLLGKIFDNKEKLMVNSYHHQAVKDLGKGLVIDAKADDGIIESIHYDDKSQWILGVQFHPEQLSRNNEDFRAIFSEFIKQANLNKYK